MRERLMENLKDAMKKGDKARTGALRQILAALKEKEIEGRVSGRPTLSDSEFLEMLQKMTRQRRESITLYQQGGREDLALKEQSEIDVIASFLPTQMSNAEISAAAAEAISQTEASSMKDMGRVVAELKKKYAGRMDFAVASQYVKTLLNG